MAAPRAAGGDKRRMILDAAVVVFAKRGFHACRVSDIADEANVAYGLVYHYFRSKDEVLDTLFLDRWNVLLDVISEIDRQRIPVREKLHAIAGFIVDSYRRDPLIAEIVAKAQAEGAFKRAVTPEFAALAFYGAIEQVLTGWIFDMLPRGEAEFDQAKTFIVETICGGLEISDPQATSSARAV
jgi:TetR/AcrR family fatty acid metabolism transcriptional regulator